MSNNLKKVVANLQPSTSIQKQVPAVSLINDDENDDLPVSCGQMILLQYPCLFCHTLVQYNIV